MTTSIPTGHDLGTTRSRQALGAIVAILAALAVGASMAQAHPGAFLLPW